MKLGDSMELSMLRCVRRARYAILVVKRLTLSWLLLPLAPTSATIAASHQARPFRTIASIPCISRFLHWAFCRRSCFQFRCGTRAGFVAYATRWNTNARRSRRVTQTHDCKHGGYAKKRYKGIQNQKERTLLEKQLHI